jgi:kynureninase
MGRRDAFEMGPGYEPAEGIRRVLSGTPSILAMLAISDTLDLIEEVGMPAIREKSIKLTAFAGEVFRRWLEPLGVELASPADPERRGGHLTVEHPAFRELTPRLWAAGVIPDFRAPRGLRLGLSPLSTSFTEVLAGLRVIKDELRTACYGQPAATASTA